MGKNSNIEWCDHTFNPWIGCQRVGPGCDNCFAEAWDRRFAVSGHAMCFGPAKSRRRTAESNWRHPLSWNAEAKKLGIRYRVFCGSLCDVFDNAVPSSWRVDLFDLIAKTPHLDWLLLTKRIGNAEGMLMDALRGIFIANNSEPPELPWPNVWIGATICNQEEADRDIPKLLRVPSVKRFISMEPMLGPIDIRHRFVACVFTESKPWGARRVIDWVIVGGETGPKARPIHPEWVRDIRDQCTADRVAFFFKQWGEFAPCRIVTIPDPVYKKGPGHDGEVWRVGKKSAGRLLDGREWDEVPRC